MPSNWHVKRPEQSIAELTENVAELQAEATEALREEGGEHGRRYRQAVSNLAVSERNLTMAKEKAKRNKELSELSASEIVDRMQR